MIQYTLSEIAGILTGKLEGDGKTVIKLLITDSRNVVSASDSLFVAIRGERHDGHDFINDMYSKGIRSFIVEELPDDIGLYPQCGFIKVEKSVAALQQLAAYHRDRFGFPVIGITGSNGKTIVKEWIFNLIESDKKIIRSPKSYNSQIGVPLSVWQLIENADLAVFEAGISKPGEMQKLQKVIKPTIGVITNIGQAHQENFDSIEEKVSEKMHLFKDCEKLIYCKDYEGIEEYLMTNHKEWIGRTFSWSRTSGADLQIKTIDKKDDTTQVWATYKGKTIDIEISFIDDASIENAIHCLALLLFLGYEADYIREKMSDLSTVAMRLELKEGINECWVIDDSYNSDLTSLTIALDFLNQQKQKEKKTLIISDILQSGVREDQLYSEVAEHVNRKKINKVIGIGESIYKYQELFNCERSFYKSTNDFLKSIPDLHFRDEVVLIKGARQFNFERISAQLQKKAHNTVLEIDLNAIAHNLNYFRSILKPETKVMVMVKAFSYGSGISEISNLMQFQRADYLAVAFADEGVELRKAGVSLPIMVLAPEEQGFDSIIEYKLEPEIYSFDSLNIFSDAAIRAGVQDYPIHIELDTGMHRLGFLENELPKLINLLRNLKSIKVKSVFSHLAASGQSNHDSFTREQISLYEKASEFIISGLGYPIIRHVLNSAGIERFPDAQFDMVRLGIGLYGISSIDQNKLQTISSLKTTIVQVKEVDAGETIGYNRDGKLNRSSRIAIIPIGYADGLPRSLGKGVGKLMVKGQEVSIVGNVCMDMCMIDITEVNADAGDEVIIFSKEYPIFNIAEQVGTIPYEVFTNISRRVKRVYFHE